MIKLKKYNRGLSNVYYLAFGVLIGIIIVVISSFIMKWKLSAKMTKEAAEKALPSPAVSVNKEASSDEAVRIDRVKDPVCGKMVNPNSDLKCQFQGKTYHFCNDICMRSFQDDPLSYVEYSVKFRIRIEPVEQTTNTDNANPSSNESVSTQPSFIPLEPVKSTNDKPSLDKPAADKPAVVELKSPPKTELAPVKPKSNPTPEEINLSGESKPSKTEQPKKAKQQKPKSKPSNPNELQIEEIPLE